MSPRNRSLGWPILVLSFLSPLSPPGPHEVPEHSRPPLTAIVTSLQGTVTAEAPSGDTIVLHPGQVIPQDRVIEVPDEGAASLVCSNDRWLHLGGGERQEISSVTCTRGRALTPGTYEAVSPGDRTLDRGTESDEVLRRVRSARTAVIKIKTRGAEETDPRIPILLHPRESSTLDPRPDLRWTRVPEARAYVLEVVGATSWTVILSAADVDCERHPHPPGSLEICTTPWPRDAPDLPSDNRSYVSVGVKTTIGGRIRFGNRHAIWRIPDQRADEIRESLDLFEEIGAGLPGTPMTELRRPVFLAKQGLLDAASDALRRILVAGPSDTGFLLLGALDLERGLPVSAARSFQAAERYTNKPEVADAAKQGLETARSLIEPNV